MIGEFGVCPQCTDHVYLVVDNFGNIFCPKCFFIENDNTE